LQVTQICKILGKYDDLQAMKKLEILWFVQSVDHQLSAICKC